MAWKLPEAWALKNLCFRTLTFCFTENLLFLVRLLLKPTWKKHGNMRKMSDKG